MTRRRWTSFFSLLTIVVDACIVLATLYIGYRANFAQPTWQAFLASQWKLAVFSVVVYTFLGAMFGAYRRCYFSPFIRQCLAMGKAYVLGTLVIFATLFLFRNTYYSQGALATYVIFFPALFIVGRTLWLLVRTGMRSRSIGTEPVVLVDLPGGEQVLFDSAEYTIAQSLKADPLDEEMTGTLTTTHQVVVRGGSLRDVLEFINRSSIVNRTAVRAVAPDVHDVLARVRLYDNSGVALTEGGIGSWGLFHVASKRAVDVLLGMLLLVMSVPVLIIVALAVFLESRNPVLFRQVRALSPGGKQIQVLKFRSMHNGDNGSASDEVLHGPPVKHPEDPRVTRVGRMIRRTSLDELPQLLNVLAGTMSLVGPRPLPLADFRDIAESGHERSLWKLRSLVKPGMTGLWQTSGRSDLKPIEMLLLDLYYVEYRSWLFDLELIQQTIPSALIGRGAY
jgi:lipopolysaccharide/colanic/teichoic acid biosynthesis glycosyltransferase